MLPVRSNGCALENNLKTDSLAHYNNKLTLSRTVEASRTEHSGDLWCSDAEKDWKTKYQFKLRIRAEPQIPFRCSWKRAAPANQRSFFHCFSGLSPSLLLLLSLFEYLKVEIDLSGPTSLHIYTLLLHFEGLLLDLDCIKIVDSLLFNFIVFAFFCFVILAFCCC